MSGLNMASSIWCSQFLRIELVLLDYPRESACIRVFELARVHPRFRTRPRASAFSNWPVCIRVFELAHGLDSDEYHAVADHVWPEHGEFHAPALREQNAGRAPAEIVPLRRRIVRIFLYR
jgi:hypothetical protein